MEPQGKSWNELDDSSQQLFGDQLEDNAEESACLAFEPTLEALANLEKLQVYTTRVVQTFSEEEELWDWVSSLASFRSLMIPFPESAAADRQMLDGGRDDRELLGVIGAHFGGESYRGEVGKVQVGGGEVGVQRECKARYPHPLVTVSDGGVHTSTALPYSGAPGLGVMTGCIAIRLSLSIKTRRIASLSR
ncbi:hypothetical protein JCM11641_001705 [Rhodosporidiobolus odoratus]